MSTSAPPGFLLAIDRPQFETTFALIKSHAVRTGLTGVILCRVLELPLSILAASLTTLNGEQINALYGTHRRKRYWPELVGSVSGPVVAMALHGPQAISRWRELLGSTDPNEAHPASLRGTYGNPRVTAENVAHGSDSPEAARRELEMFAPRSLTLRA